MRPTSGFGFVHGWIVGDNTSAENEKAAKEQEDLGSAWRFQSLKLVTTSLYELRQALDFGTVEVRKFSHKRKRSWEVN